MQRIKLTLAYVGTNYSGWQFQANPECKTKQKTIQGELEKSLTKLTSLEIRVSGAGRTDAGVHADGQVAHFSVPKYLAEVNWRHALNNLLPGDIRVVAHEKMDNHFHSRVHAKSKIYVYQLWTNIHYTPPKLYPYVWAVGELDLTLLEQAIPYLCGKHDFSSFQNSGTFIKSSVRNLYSIKMQTFDLADGKIVELSFEADGFLKQMVRNLVGLLVAIATEKFDLHDIAQLIAQKKRNGLILTADAKGLTLKEVKYSTD